MYPASLNNLTVRIQKTTRKIFARLHCYFFAKKFLDRYFNALNSTPETYSTYKHRDLGLSRPIVNFPSQEFQLMKPDLGIVIQGPILRHQNFTYSTILRYLHFFPGAQIVLSTWKGEDIDAFLLVKEKFPNLSANDIKMCAYLRMNLSTKEIASILNISARGVEISRYRLRKKMDLENATNLTDFLLRL